MPGVGIQDQLCTLQMLEHEVGIPIGKHGVVAPAHHQNGLIDGLEDGIFGIFGCAPVDKCLGLRIADSLTALWISILGSHARPLEEPAPLLLVALVVDRRIQPLMLR
jgi:hypothetical protein